MAGNKNNRNAEIRTTSGRRVGSFRSLEDAQQYIEDNNLEQVFNGGELKDLIVTARRPRNRENYIAQEESTRINNIKTEQLYPKNIIDIIQKDSSIISNDYDNNGILVELSNKNKENKRKELEEQLNKLDAKSLQQLIYPYAEPLISTPKNKQDTKKIQEFLISKGYNVGKTGVDGIFGKNTKKALNDYNKDKFIDGIIGPRTLKAKQKYIDHQRDKSDYAVPFNDCDIDGCAKFVTKKYEQINGAKASLEDGVILDAWNMPKQIEAQGGNIIYNLYDDDNFKNIKSIKELHNATRKSLEEHPLNYSTLNIGDVVGIYMPSSDMHTVALKNGSTKNTHVGIVVDYDEDGMPIIQHNIHKHIHTDKANNISGSKTGKARITVVARPKTGNLSLQELQYTPEEFEYNIKNDKGDNIDFNDDMKQYSNSVTGFSHQVLSELYPDINMEDVIKASVGILKRETNYMQVTEDDLGFINKNITKIARKIKGKTAEDTSSKLTKTKLSTFTHAERKILGLQKANDLNNPNKAAKAVSYLIAKNANYFKQFAKNNPNFNISDKDCINLAILAYNQGMSKLKTIAQPNKNNTNRLNRLRTLYFNPNSKIKDYRSTKYKYLGDVGKVLYDYLGDEFVPYVGSAVKEMNKMINKEPIYKGELSELIVTPKNTKRYGGRITLSSNY